MEKTSIQWNGDNLKKTIEFLEGINPNNEKCDNNFVPLHGKNYKIKEVYYDEPPQLFLLTKRGEMKVLRGDMIIRRAKDDFYPCPKDIYEFIKKQ